MTRSIPRSCASLLALVLAGCGGGLDAGPDTPDANPTTDAPTNVCFLAVQYGPAEPVPGPDRRVTLEAIVANVQGVVSFQWVVRRDGVVDTPVETSADGRVASFAIPIAGTYNVTLRAIPSSGEFCTDATASIPAFPPGAGQAELRAHVVAPDGTTLPPLDTPVLVTGNPTYELPHVLDIRPGVTAAGTVSGSGTPTPAYMKFMPRSGAAGFVEAFADGNGGYAATVRSEPHDVLVIPFSSTLAPRVLEWQPGVTVFDVDGGSTITGTISDANGPLAGAKVQLSVDGVLSTLFTTGGTGQYTIHAVGAAANVPVTVEVEPPPGRGLPRLVVTASDWNFAQPVNVTFASLATRDLGGTVIRRGGTPVPNARLAVVGAVTGAGTIAGKPATGEVRLTATANASGVVPPLLAPARALSAVVETATGDYAVSALDLTAAAPPSISAPAMIASTTTVVAPDNTTALDGAVLEAVPRGALQLAGAPTRRFVAGATGQLAVSLASGGVYDLRYLDPKQRHALREVDGAGPTLPATQALRTATLVTARVVSNGNSVAGALVQFRCPTCTGVEASRPIAEGVTRADGRITLAVPRP